MTYHAVLHRRLLAPRGRDPRRLPRLEARARLRAHGDDRLGGDLVRGLGRALSLVAGGARLDAEVYTWLAGEGSAAGGLPRRPLTVTMMCVVTFVSLMVHVYTIGYMADDPATSASSPTSRSSPSR
jgi:hypothetical protein